MPETHRKSLSTDNGLAGTEESTEQGIREYRRGGSIKVRSDHSTALAGIVDQGIGHKVRANHKTTLPTPTAPFRLGSSESSNLKPLKRP